MSRHTRSRARRNASTAAPAQATFKRITAIAAAVAAVAAALATMTSLFDWFERRVEPEPAAAPTTIDARIEAAELKTTTEPLADYLRSTKQSLEGLDGAERREPGLVFSVRVRLRGGTGASFPLHWTLYDARKGRAVPGKLYRQEAVAFVPEAATHARTWPIWVPHPPRPGRYRLDLVLADDKGQQVDERSSRDFTLEQIPVAE